MTLPEIAIFYLLIGLGLAELCLLAAKNAKPPIPLDKGYPLLIAGWPIWIVLLLAYIITGANKK